MYYVVVFTYSRKSEEGGGGGSLEEGFRGEAGVRLLDFMMTIITNTTVRMEEEERKKM